LVNWFFSDKKIEGKRPLKAESSNISDMCNENYTSGAGGCKIYFSKLGEGSAKTVRGPL
jgi:hypothetical protein